MNRSTPAIRSLAALALALTVVACTSSGSDAARTTTTATATSTTSGRPVGSNEDSSAAQFAHGWPKASGGECDGNTPGQDGVLMTFCHGPATVTAQLSDGTHTLKGVCWFNGTALEIDAGTTVGQGWKGPWPDYVTMQLPGSPGQVNNSFVAFFGGTQHLVQTALGTLTADGIDMGFPIPPTRIEAKHVTADAAGAAAGNVRESLHIVCG